MLQLFRVNQTGLQSLSQLCFLGTLLLLVVLTENSDTTGTDVESQIQTTVKPSTFGLKFQKCVQLIGSEVSQMRFYLVIKNPPEGTDLSQLAIHDAVSDITLLQGSGNLQERGYQTFTTDSLPAGSDYVVTYTASVEYSKNEVLFLPAFLTFSNASQNDIHLFGPVVANFTLRLNTTEKVYVNHALHFAGFCGAFLVSTVLFSLTLLSVSCLYNKCCSHSPQHWLRCGLSPWVEPVEAISKVSESANEQAAFEDKFIDILALEDAGDVFQALDNLEMSTLLHEALAVECVRVQVVKGVFEVLLGSLGEPGRRLVTVLRGQVTGMEGKLLEEQGARLAMLAAHCTMETQQEMETQHHTHSAEKTYAESLFQHAEQKEVRECTVLLEDLHKLQQKRLHRGLMVRHEQASAQAHRHTALHRRVELHTIFTEELEEAARTGELDKDTANRLMHQYYSCQDQFEEVLDLFVASQRTVLRERHAQRQFLLQGLGGLQRALCDLFRASSQHLDSWLAEICREGGLSDQQCTEQLEQAQLALLQVKQTLEETVRCECRKLHCDIIKKRRACISEVLCDQMREQQELACVCEGQVDHYLLQWQVLLSSHSTHFSELITYLDQDAAAEIRKVLLHALQKAVDKLKAIGDAVAETLEALGVPRWLLQRELGGKAVADAQEKLHVQEREAAASLRSVRTYIQQSRLQELQLQTDQRERLRQFCRTVCTSQCALSETDLLRVKLQCVKCMCRLDRCLFTKPAPQHAQPDHKTDFSDPSMTFIDSKVLNSRELLLEARVCAGDLGDVGSFRRNMEERINFLQQNRENNTAEEEYVCADVEQKVCVCEQSVVMELAAVLWERAEKRSRVLETHSALLSLQTFLLKSLQQTETTQQLKHIIHTQSLAIEETELQLQKEESALEELVFGQDSNKMFTVDTEIEDVLFSVDKDCRMAALLQEVLCKREKLTDTLIERLREANRRQQVMEDLRNQLELKQLHAHCDQDLVLSAVFVKLSGVSVVVLQELLHLLLPTLPEGELQSLTDALGAKARLTPGTDRELVDRLRSEIIIKNLPSCSQPTDRETDRLLKKKQSLLEMLFSSSPEGLYKDTQMQQSEPCQKISAAKQQASSEPASVSVNANMESASGPKPLMGGGKEEGQWPTNSTSGDKVGMPMKSMGPGKRPARNQDENSQTLVHACRRKRNVLIFKKGTVVPQEQT